MTEEDSFEKIKKGAKETGHGVEDTSEAVLNTAEGVKDAAEGVVEGVKETAEGVVEGVKDTVQGVKEGVEETADVFEESADKVTESDTYKRISEESKNAKYDENRDYNKSGGKEPMNPEDIASHEPTAVKRDKKQGTSGDPV
jgi:methyl-accepting chemotaxis protein